MVASSYANLVKVGVTGTPGTGTITLGSRVAPYFGVGELTNGATYAYSILDGNNVCSGHGVYTASGTTLARDAAERCIVAGTPQSTPMSLTSAAVVRFDALASDFADLAAATALKLNLTGGNLAGNLGFGASATYDIGPSGALPRDVTCSRTLGGQLLSLTNLGGGSGYIGVVNNGTGYSGHSGPTSILSDYYGTNEYGFFVDNGGAFTIQKKSGAIAFQIKDSSFFDIGYATRPGTSSSFTFGDATHTWSNGHFDALTMYGPIALKGYTVATLPAGAVGQICYVTDALAVTVKGATVAGGGSAKSFLIHNGSNWVGV